MQHNNQKFHLLQAEFASENYLSKSPRNSASMSDTKKPAVQPIANLLQPTGRDLQTVLSKVKAINTLNEVVQGLLDDGLKKYCRVGNLSNGILVLLVDNSAVATQMRYTVPTLLSQLRGTKALRHIKEIQLKVRLPEKVDVKRGETGVQQEKMQWLSQDAAETLRAMAESIEDERLRGIMLRIAGKKA